MTTKRKPTLKQLFKAWLNYEKKSNETFKLKWALEDLAKNTIPGTELIVHDNVVYRITTTSSHRGCVYTVERIAQAEELKTIK
jgi:hypothetical protein